MVNPKFYCLVPNVAFFSLDMRDRIALILGFCEASKIYANECFLNFVCEEIGLYQLMGFCLNDHSADIKMLECPDSSLIAVFEVSKEESKDYGISNARQNVSNMYQIRECNENGYYGLFNNTDVKVCNIDFQFFYKALELHSRGDPEKHLAGLGNRFCYVSGCAKARPATRDVIIAPEWEWMGSSDVRLSGVNFMSEFVNSDVNRIKIPKKYRCIYVGSSSVNKFAPAALLILVLSRLRLGSKAPKDIFLCYRFYGGKGSFVWMLLVFMSKAIDFFKFGIDMQLSEDKINKETVNQFILQSHFGLVPYLREGFPRVIGDFVLRDCRPIILKWMQFGGKEFAAYSIPYSSLKHTLNTLAKFRNSHLEEKHDMREIKSFFEPEGRISKLLTNDLRFDALRRQLSFCNRRASSIVIYSLLTNDVTWLGEASKSDI